jgi:DNA-binding response OmpR family regulator
MTRLGPTLHPARRRADIPGQIANGRLGRESTRVTDSPKHRTSVLAVDDDPDLLLLLRSTVEGDGFRAILASNGQKALELIADESPDVVCLDLMMPVLDGWGVLEELNGREDPPPVIVLSAKTADEDIVRAFSLGASAYVFKPFDPSRLVDTIRSILAATPAERRERTDRELAMRQRRDIAS